MRMKLQSMMILYAQQLVDLLHAERQLLKALPTTLKAAGNESLREALMLHTEETRNHIRRLERILGDLDIPVPSRKFPAMEGLIAEVEDTARSDGDDAVRDAAIIAAEQRIEHYEIAGYGCARTFAQLLGRGDDAEELQRSLDEKHAADQQLTDLAESSINLRAANV